MLYCHVLYSRVPEKWGLQQTHYPLEPTGQTNPLELVGLTRMNEKRETMLKTDTKH